jgi:hypothetical protein
MASWLPYDPGWPGVTEGLGTFRFGGTPFGTLGVPSGTFPPGNCFSPGEAVGVGFLAGPVGKPPGVPADFTVGKAPGAPEGFATSRFGGTGFFPAVGVFGVVPGVVFAFGKFTLGFIKFGGAFCEATGSGETVAAADPLTRPLSTICGCTRGVGFGRAFGGGFCSAMIFWSFSVS